MLRRSRSAPAVLALLASLLIAAPVAAQSGPSAQREAAEDALEEVQELAEGHGVRTGRELSTALAELAARRSSLSRADGKEADRLLARPTNAAGDGVTGPYSASARVLRNCSSHFCIHWVDSTNDAPPLTNIDSCPTPDYVDAMRRAFEQSYDVENTQLLWQRLASDGDLGGNAKTDVYVKDIGDDGTYGYAVPDAGQQSQRSQHAFQVMDDDYAPDEFDYADPTVPMRVTAAHEYNHILQYGYDALQDTWMFESTATWAEDKVFDGINDWFLYLPSWAALPTQAITFAGDGDLPSADDLKMYGSAIWNHWVERKYGATTVRRAWELSQTPSVDGFAPAAYEQAIREVDAATSFTTVFAEFAAATAEWKLPDSGIHEGDEFRLPPFSVQDVARDAPLAFGTPRNDLTVDHTAFRLFNVPIPVGAPADVRLVGSLTKPLVPGLDGSIALVGRKSNGEVTAVMNEFDAAGDAAVTLQSATGYQRITAVVVNADIGEQGFNSTTRDWNWTGDGADATLEVSRVTGTPEGRTVEETGTTTSPGAPPTADCGTTTVEREPPVVTPTPSLTPNPTVAPTVPPTVTPTPTIEPPVATSVRLTRNSSRISSVLRKGVLSLFARTSKAGLLSARATVDRKTARRLRVGRRTTTVGRGRRTATAPARLKVNVKLTRKLRNALKRKRNRKRSLKVKVVVTFTPVDGTAADRDTIVIKLRP